MPLWDQMSTRQKAGLGALCLLGLLGLGVRLMPEAPAKPASVQWRESSQSQGDPTTPTPAPQVGEKVIVQIDGAVKNPGEYHLAKGVRVEDAIQQAGGYAIGADWEALNRVKKLTDGERLTVEWRAELGAVDVAPLNLNQATEPEILGHPDFGPDLGARVFELRTRVGRFRSLDQLYEIPGMTRSKILSLRVEVGEAP